MYTHQTTPVCLNFVDYYHSLDALNFNNAYVYICVKVGSVGSSLESELYRYQQQAAAAAAAGPPTAAAHLSLQTPEPTRQFSGGLPPLSPQRSLQPEQPTRPSPPRTRQPPQQQQPRRRPHLSPWKEHSASAGSLNSRGSNRPGIPTVLQTASSYGASPFAAQQQQQQGSSTESNYAAAIAKAAQVGIYRL